jgi:hypothetical protein
LALTATLRRAGVDDLVYVVLGGPKLRHARIGLRFARASAVRKKLTLIEDSSDGFTLVRPDGRKIRFECFAASRGGDNVRGVHIIAAHLSEAAFYFDETTGVVNAEQIFAAIVPRLLPEGQIIVESSPWAQIGLLFVEFKRNWGKPETGMAAHCPTPVMRDDPETQAMIATERARDPDNARRELDGEFMTVGVSQLFDPVMIDQAVDKSLQLGTEPAREGVVCARGVDLGFVNDAAVGLDVERSATCYRVLGWDEIFAATEKLKPSQVLKRLGSAAINQGIEEMVADQHYAETAREAFGDMGLVFITVPGGQQGKAEMFLLVRRLMNEGQLRFPDNPRLLEQLRSVTKKPLPGGGIAIEMPRSKRGGHCDLVSALVHAVWRLYTAEVPEILHHEPDPLKREAQAWQQRIEDRIQEEEGGDDEFDPYKQNGWMLR